MGLRVFLSAAALVWSACICPVLCIQCNLTNNAGPDGGHVVFSQEDVDRLVANCTELRGSLIISSNYTGSIVFDGITALDFLVGDIGQVWTEERGSTGNPTLTSISLPDMILLGQLNIGNASALTNVSIPRATDIGEIWVGGLPGTNFDLKSVTKLSDMQIIGKIFGVYFNSLVQVSGNLAIVADSGSELILDCPVLQNTSSLSLQGNLNSIVLPQLQLVADPELEINEGVTIEIDNGNRSFDIFLPALSRTTNTKFKGSIGSINLPSLTTVNDTMSISASLPLYVNLTHLESVDEIDIDGNITGAEFPALRHVQSIEITSGVSMNCTPALTTYELYHTDSSPNSFACHTPLPTPQPQPPKHLSLGAKLGIGIGVAAGVLGLFLGLSIWKLYSKHEENNRLQSAIKLQQLTGDGETLPDYQTAVGPTVRRRATLQNGEAAVQGSEGGTPAGRSP